MTITKLNRITDYCPTQWHGVTDSNEPVYIRYRWGELVIRVGQPGQDIDSAIDGTIVFSGHKKVYREFDGTISFRELKSILRSNNSDVVIECKEELREP